jgi:hypothetical protein
VDIKDLERVLNMKNIKKLLLAIFVLGLTVALAACGNNKKDEGDYTVSNVLNAKKMVPVVVTNSKDGDEKDHVVWAGYMGQGKVKAMFLDGMLYDYGYKDLKKLSDEKYNRSLIDMGKDYKPTPFKYVTSKGKTILKTNYKTEDNNKNKAEAVTLKFMKKGKQHGGIRDAMNKAVYSKVAKKDKDDEWATIKSEQKDSEGNDVDTSGYEMHIKLGKGNAHNLKLEDAKETKKNYDNVEVDDSEY